MLNKPFCILLLLVGLVYADDTSLVTAGKNASAPTPAKLNLSSGALSQADTDYNELNAAKRKAAIAQEKAKLNPVVKTGNNQPVQPLGETTVNNIIITPTKSFAELQFNDGSTLVVGVGDKVSNYTVQDISMNGVKIAVCSTKCGKSTLLKRKFGRPPMKSNSAISPLQNQSTSVISTVNNGGDLDVPPIQAAGR